MAYYPDSLVLHGKYSADTLYYGSRRDTLGRVYTGYMDSHAQANGHGTLREPGGLSYSGQWRPQGGFRLPDGTQRLATRG